jgi:hypothetical protein
MARLLDNKPGESLTVKLTAAITNSNVFVKFDTDRDYAVVCGAGEDADGVISYAGIINETLEMTIDGVVLILLGDTVANGAYVMSDASGRAVTATGTYAVLGQVIRGGAVGELGSLRLGKKGSSAATVNVMAKGTGTLNGTTPVVITNALVAANDAILLTRLVSAGTPGHFGVGTITPGVSFTVVGTASDTSTFSWAIVR